MLLLERLADSCDFNQKEAKRPLYPEQGSQMDFHRRSDDQLLSFSFALPLLHLNRVERIPQLIRRSHNLLYIFNKDAELDSCRISCPIFLNSHQLYPDRSFTKVGATDLITLDGGKTTALSNLAVM